MCTFATSKSKKSKLLNRKKEMKMKDTIKKMMLAGMMMLTCTAVFAEETQVTDECDTIYIKLDENREPINYVNWAKEDLVAAVGELETILETDCHLPGAVRRFRGLRETDLLRHSRVNKT